MQIKPFEFEIRGFRVFSSLPKGILQNSLRKTLVNIIWIFNIGKPNRKSELEQGSNNFKLFKTVMM